MDRQNDASGADPTTSGERPSVIERKERLDGTSEEFRCEILLMEPGRRAVLRYVTDRQYRVGDLTVPPGTVTISHYWSDRPYNVYHWIGGPTSELQGRTLAYYANVADRTRIGPDLVAYRDLTVDVLVRPSGETEILDEEDLPVDLEPAARRTVATALDALGAAPRRLAAEIEKESRRLLG